MQNGLERFKNAQANGVYEKALAEVRNGRKQSHWMWFIFPQLKGLGRSPAADFYGIADLDEANRYLQDETLGARLREICAALLELGESDPEKIFGAVDAMKLRSAMTLFELASPEKLFGDVLNRFFAGVRDNLTLSIIESSNG